VTDIVSIAGAAVDAGTNGLSIMNTTLGMAINVETFKPKLSTLTGGLSGPAIRPIAVRCVFQVAQAFPDVPIIGQGGIAHPDDVAEFLLAGAWAVAVGTANFVNPMATVTILEGLREYLIRKGLSDVNLLRTQLKMG
jgi:dihydroorotate dehydrogenase (NAD+) catalytic subunit